MTLFSVIVAVFCVCFALTILAAAMTILKAKGQRLKSEFGAAGVRSANLGRLLRFSAFSLQPSALYRLNPGLFL